MFNKKKYFVMKHIKKFNNGHLKESLQKSSEIIQQVQELFTDIVDFTDAEINILPISTDSTRANDGKYTIFINVGKVTSDEYYKFKKYFFNVNNLDVLKEYSKMLKIVIDESYVAMIRMIDMGFEITKYEMFPSGYSNSILIEFMESKS
jgi:hypothetical protein